MDNLRPEMVDDEEEPIPKSTGILDWTWTYQLRKQIPKAIDSSSKFKLA